MPKFPSNKKVSGVFEWDVWRELTLLVLLIITEGEEERRKRWDGEKETKDKKLMVPC